MSRTTALLLSLALLTTALPALAPADTGPRSPDFAMRDLDGRMHRLADYRGRWVILNYWASWCPPCVDEIPELVAFHDANPRHVVLGLNFEDLATDRLRAFVAAHGIDYPVLPTGPRAPDFAALRGLPTTWIFNPEGELIADHVGSITRATLEDFIAREEARATH